MPPESVRSSDPSGRKGQADAWGAFGLVTSGVLVWGGVGWLLSEWLDNRLFVMVGLLVGMAAALYLVWFRYGRQ
jgi:ATP synthase protein I